MMKKKQTVLIVDDQYWREYLAFILGDNYAITGASNYQEAKDKLATKKPAFDVTILDVILDKNDSSNTDGLLLLQDIETNKIPTNAVIYSGYLSLKVVKLAMSKPFVFGVVDKGEMNNDKELKEAVAKAGSNAIEKQEKIRIFISYAKEDIKEALSIFYLLKRNGFEPFLDEKSLIPGSDWEMELEKAIRESHFFLACLSTHSVMKEGYFQKELSRGLEHLERKPESSIFLIPVRLDECSIPQRFQPLQWCDFFMSDGPEKLIKAIYLGCQKRGLQY